jgi:hypothetical protein
MLYLLVQVSKIFNDVDASQLEAAAAAAGKQQQLEEVSLSPEEFAQMRRDVELLGESAVTACTLFGHVAPSCASTAAA